LILELALELSKSVMSLQDELWLVVLEGAMLLPDMLNPFGVKGIIYGSCCK